MRVRLNPELLFRNYGIVHKDFEIYQKIALMTENFQTFGYMASFLSLTFCHSTLCGKEWFKYSDK